MWMVRLGKGKGKGKGKGDGVKGLLIPSRWTNSRIDKESPHPT
jgi:hypothetical protein